MPIQKSPLKVLVIEDNPGDFVLIQEYLKEKIIDADIHRCSTFGDAEEKLKDLQAYDAILLDLSLPDAEGEQLTNDILKLAGQTPVIVLTGYADRDFGIRTISLGVSDYLFKDELSASQLFKSIFYGIERKRIVRQLGESEAKYKKLFHLSPLPMWVYDVNTLEFLNVNESAITHYGYSRDEFLSMKLSDIWSYKNYQEYLNKLEQIKMPETNVKGIVQHARKSGELMFVEIQSHKIEFDKRDARIVLATDITEKNKAAKALQLSEQRFKALVQDGSDLIAILGTEGNYKYVSPASQSILGINSAELVGKKAMDFIHEADKERVQHQFDLLNHEKFIHIGPFRFRDVNDNWRWIETKLTNMVNDPAVGGIVANAIEVSERIEHETKIKESVERFNIVSKATSDVIWDWDMKTNQVEWNENLRSVLGYTNVTTSFTFWEENIHPEDGARVLKKAKASISAVHSYWSDEYRFRCADRSYKYFFDRGYLITDSNGDPVRMIGSMQDITRRKEEEHRLKLLESVITNATDAVMITEAEPITFPGPKIVYVNDAFTRMTGYEKEEVLGKDPRFLQGPRSSRQELNKLRRALEKGEPCEIEIVNYKKNGQQFWMNMAVAPVADSTNTYTHWISIQRDITDRMNYVKAIEDQNERLKEIAWTQSHVVRAPLARIMGLVEILPKYDSYKEIPKELLHYILNSAHELDHIIRDIVVKTEVIYNSTKNET
jgi:PAS domain S-box-containing protein